MGESRDLLALTPALLLAGFLYLPINGGAADLAAAPELNERTDSEPHTPTKVGALDLVHRQWLVTNFVNYGRATPATFGYLSTNTVAFQEYGLNFMLALANDVNRKWHLELPDPLTSDHVTEFTCGPRTNSFTASVIILKRYGFLFSEGRFESYSDLDYWENAYEGKPELFFERAKQPNQLTKAEALQMARNALHSLGLTEEKMKISHTPAIVQSSYLPQGANKRQPISFYKIEWKYGYAGEPAISAAVDIDVSGITKQLVYFACTQINVPKVLLPAHYWQLLGLAPPATDFPALQKPPAESMHKTNSAPKTPPPRIRP